MPAMAKQILLYSLETTLANHNGTDVRRSQYQTF